MPLSDPASQLSHNTVREEMALAFLKEKTDFKNAELLPLAGDASFRRYIRVKQGGKTALLMDAPPEKEDARKYLVIAEYLHGHGYSTPVIYASNITSGFILLEDFGDDSFTNILKRLEGREKEEKERELYESAIDLLADWHVRKRVLVDVNHLTLNRYKEQLLLQEVSLFAEWYLPQVLGKEKAASLYDEYLGIWKSIIGQTNLETDIFVHRDYHADNLMWLPGRQSIKRLGLLDFQDAVYGDSAYDLVSLIQDARRDIPDALKHYLMLGYLYATTPNKDRFMTAYSVLGAQRNSKIVGIFVRLAARDNKHIYLDMLGRVWRHLESDLEHPAMAPLKNWVDKHISKEWRGAVEIRHNARDLAQGV